MVKALLAVLLLAPFDVRYDGVPEEARAAFDEAASVWSACLAGDVPIKARVTWIARGPTGFAYPRLVAGETADGEAVWVPAALAHARAGTRLGDGIDFHVFLQGGEDRYYGPAGGIAEGQTDFVNVSIHEIAHGLGVATGTFVPWEDDGDGTRKASSGLPNAYTDYFDFGFAMPELDGTPFLYDTFLRLADGRRVTDFENPSAALAHALSNPTVHFVGENAVAANAGYPVGVTPGNVSHVPAFPGRPTPIMLSNSGRGETVRRLDPILLGMMRDPVWAIEPACL